MSVLPLCIIPVAYFLNIIEDFQNRNSGYSRDSLFTELLNLKKFRSREDISDHLFQVLFLKKREVVN